MSTSPLCPIERQCHLEDCRFITQTVPVAVKQNEVKQIIDAHNRNLKKQKIRDDAAEILRKELSTHAGRKRLKNKQKALASERKRQQRASQGTWLVFLHIFKNLSNPLNHIHIYTLTYIIIT